MFRASALGLPKGGPIRDSWEHVLLRALALGLPGREVLYVTLEVHVLFRALAFGLPVREVLYMTPRSTSRSRR